MRVFSPIVEAAADLLAIGVADLAHRRRIGPKPIRNDRTRWAIFLHNALEELERRGLVPLRRDHSLQHLAFMINSAPKIAKPAVDFYKRLVHMPAPLRIAAQMGDTPLSDLRGEHRSETVPPEPDRLMADFDPALGQQILDVAKRQRVSHVQHHDQGFGTKRLMDLPVAWSDQWSALGLKDSLRA